MNQDFSQMTDNQLKAIYFNHVVRVDESVPIIRAIEVEFDRRKKIENPTSEGENMRSVIENNSKK